MDLGEVVGHPLDVADPESREAIVDLIERRYGLLDVLINNAAGSATYGEQAADADLETTRVVFENGFSALGG